MALRSKTHPSITHAIADLRDNPTDERGYARHSLFVAAELDWHCFDDGPKFRATLEELRSQVIKKTTWVEQCEPSLQVQVRLGGDGCNGGLTGCVNVWITPRGVPQYMN